MYAQLKQSYQWNMLNDNQRVINKVQKILKTGEAINFDRMPTVLSVMKNRVKSPIFNKMLEAINNEQMVLVFNSEGDAKAPGFLPFVIMQAGTYDYRAIIFLDLCEARIGDGDEIFVNERKLKVVMESAYIALCMLDDKNRGKLQTANIVRPSSKIYAYAITECINRKHSIKMDQNVFNAMIYLLSKFFIRTTLGCTSNEDVVETYCMSNCQNPYPAAVHQIADQFEDSDFENIASLIKKMTEIPELAPRLGKLTVSNFTESYINMYDISMLLAMENFPYLVFNILSVIDTTYINNYYHLKNIVGDEGKKLHATLITTIC